MGGVIDEIGGLCVDGVEEEDEGEERDDLLGDLEELGVLREVPFELFLNIFFIFEDLIFESEVAGDIDGPRGQGEAKERFALGRISVLWSHQGLEQGSKQFKLA